MKKAQWLALAGWLEKFSAGIGSGPTRLQDTETLGANYPGAWPKLQKRRRAMKWSNAALFTLLIGLAALRLCDFLMPSSRASIDVPSVQGLAIGLIALFLALSFYATLFRCPRCGQHFFQVNARGADYAQAIGAADAA